MLTELIEPSLSELIFVSYEGDVDDETQAYHGQGSAVLDSGCKYDGNFVNGMMHGQGKFSWPDGVDYEGEFVYGRMTGLGAYFWPDGSSYKGPVDDGLRHGKGGVFKCSAGQVYDGEWERGKRQGKGKMTYTADGLTVYTGDWVDDKRDGYGMMKYSSGNTYEGFWSGDLKTGRGVMTWKTADELYVGDWLNDQPHGNGEHIWGLGHTPVPASTNTNNSNPPVVYNSNRQVCNMYRGTWAYGKRHGAGTFFYSNGSQYTGQWVNNLKHGEGVFVSPLGNIAVGDFEDDKMLLPPPAPIVSASITNPRPAAAAVNVQSGVRKTNPGGGGNAGLGASRGMQSGVAGKKGAAIQTPALRGTEDVGPQVTLNITDALSTLPQPTPKRDPSAAAATTSVAVGDSSTTAMTGALTSPLGATTSPTPGSTVVNSIGATSCGFYRQDLSTLEAQTKELERILLRYNQFTKSIYKRYAEMSTHNRGVGVDTTTSSHGVNPDQFTEQWDPVEKLIFRSRALTSSLRMQCMDVEHFLRFCREASLCGTACNAFDLLSCLVDMRNHHNHIAKRAQQDNRSRRRAEAETSQVNDTVLQYLQDPGPLRARVASLLNAEVGPFASAIPGVSRLDDPDTKRSQQSVEALLQRDLRQPILEREFPELLLRVMIREYLLRGVLDPHGTEKDFGHALMAKVTNCMADKVYPISLPAWTDAVPPFVLAYYHPSVQGLLRSHSSVVKSLWTRLEGGGGGGAGIEGRQSKEAVVRVRNVAAMMVGLNSIGAVSDEVNTDIAKLLAAMGLLTLETPPATNNNLADHQSSAVETKESDPGQGLGTEGEGEVGVTAVSPPPPLPPGSDLMCLFRKINFEDFKFLLCHTVLSSLWVYRIYTAPPAAVSGGDDEGETTNAVAEDGEGSAEGERINPLPSVADDEISRAEAGMSPTEILASRLELWLPRMDAAALIIPVKWKS